jgi:hypothetical protein
LKQYLLLPKTTSWAKTEWLKGIFLIRGEPGVSVEPTLRNEAVRKCKVGGGMVRGVVVAGYYRLNRQVSGLALEVVPTKRSKTVRISIVYVFRNPIPSNFISTLWDTPCETRYERRVYPQRFLNNCSEICKLCSLTKRDFLVCSKRATDLLGEALYDERVLTEVENAPRD